MSNYWSPGLTLEMIEKEAILKAYNYFQKNKTQTALALGITTQTLHNKLNKYEEDQKADEQRVIEQRRREEELQRRAKGSINSFEPGPWSPTGVHVESPAKDPAQPSLPLSKREKVQAVSQEQASAGNSNRRR